MSEMEELPSKAPKDEGKEDGPAALPAPADEAVSTEVSGERQQQGESAPRTPTETVHKVAESADQPYEQVSAAEGPSTPVPAVAPSGSESFQDSVDAANEDAARNVAEMDAANAAVLAESRRRTRRSFVGAAAAAAAGYSFYRWIDGSPGIEMQPGPLRRAFEANAEIARAVFRDHALAPTYSLKDARDLRVNGVYGLKKELVPESWRLQLVGVRGAASHPRFTDDVTAWDYRYTDANSHEDQGHDTKIDPNARTSGKMAPEQMLGQAKIEEDRAARMPRGLEEAGESYSTLKPGTPGLLLTLNDILALPRRELVTQFKCIEGWSEVVHWAGVRMSDFLDAYPPQSIDGREPDFVYMETPDGDYYTGYDMNVCRHPQTLLVTEMMGAPLTQFHGAPLRLHMPTKYGYKQIKRIGLVCYMMQKPDDYWTKLGYDWYAGL